MSILTSEVQVSASSKKRTKNKKQTNKERNKAVIVLGTNV